MSIKSCLPRSMFVALILCAISVSLSRAARAEAPPPPMIEVTGEGDVKVEPDQVVLRLGLETFGPRLKEVQQAIADRTQTLIGALKSRGVKAGEIQTEMVQINPHYDFDKNKRKFIEYTARKNFVVTLVDVESYGDILERALAAGVDHVDGLEFNSSKLSQLKDIARKLAVQDAKRRADLMAGTLGQVAGKAIRIQEINIEPPPPVLMRAALAESFKGGGVHDAIAPGELSVKSSVIVQFELK